VIKNLGLPIVAVNDSPIFFVGISIPKLGYELVSRMKESGYYMNIGIFPAVPIKNTGIRFTITRLHTFKQISDMLSVMSKHYFQILKEEDFPLEKVYKAFKMKNPDDVLIESRINELVKPLELKIEVLDSIKQIDKNTWDNLFKNKGAFNYDTLLMYEQVFKNKYIKQNNWDFDYIIIRDLHEKIIFATFLTTTVQKDDIFSIADISKLIEKERVSNPYYLVSKVLSIGCGLSIGEQVYVDESNALWTDAVNLFLNEVEVLKEKRKVDKIMLRDFNIVNERFKNLIEEKGYFSMDLPENNVIEETFINENEFLKSLNSNRRRHYKKQIKIENYPFSSIKFLKLSFAILKSRNLILSTFLFSFNISTSFKNKLTASVQSG
jgi:hypothetical protein